MASPMTVDELTELECVLDDCIREAVARGFRMSTKCHDDCALAAVASVLPDCWHWGQVFNKLGLPDFSAVTFGAGFDLPSWVRSPDGGSQMGPIGDMGLRFRERFDRGEYSR